MPLAPTINFHEEAMRTFMLIRAAIMPGSAGHLSLDPDK